MAGHSPDGRWVHLRCEFAANRDKKIPDTVIDFWAHIRGVGDVLRGIRFVASMAGVNINGFNGITVALAGTNGDNKET